MYRAILRPILFRFNSDLVHEATVRWAARAARSGIARELVRKLYDFQRPALQQQFLGLSFRNPVGLAAGFDKNGTLAPMLQALGFGFAEVGSITANASAGNPKPRSFRLPEDESLINRMGLNNDGAEAIVRRLEALSLSIPLGVNIAKTHDPAVAGELALEDYRKSLLLAKSVADYITINISCPNTREGKTFEDPESLMKLLGHLLAGDEDAEMPPMLLKLSSDLDLGQLHELLAIAESNGISGYVAVNTSNRRDGLRSPAGRIAEIGAGGLSGRAIREQSNRILSAIREQAGDTRLLIGVGGISSAEDAIEKIRLGADLLQVYTGLVYQGPGLVRSINRGIFDYMERNGLERIRDIHGRPPH